VTIFAFVLFIVSLIYLSKSEVRQNSSSIALLVLAGFSATQFLLFDNRFISVLNFLFLSTLFIYWVCLSTDRRIDKELSVYIFGDAVKQVLSTPFLNYGCCASAANRLLKHRKARGIVPALVGIILFMPRIVIVLVLLVSADAAFSIFITRVFDFISIDRPVIYAIQFLIGIPVAFYLYGLIYGDVKGRRADLITVESVDKAAKFIEFAPKMAIYSALSSFNAIYFLFFAVQASYLLSAFSGDLPAVFTYAEYARRGFFELCAVAGINLGILAVSHLTIRHEPGKELMVLRIESFIISSFTLLLIVTALSKMVMYIDIYGLTQLRVYTSWFMVLLFFIFIVISVRQIIKFNAAKPVIIGFVIMFMLLSYGNIDGFIAKYNISRHEAGTLKTLDLDMIAGLSDATVPYLYDLYLKTNDSDTQMKQKLESLIINGKSYNETGFREFNYQRYRADEIRALLVD
jgi:hypothetical protein